MPIVFACRCRCTVSVPDACAGHLTFCPRCGSMLKVPTASDARQADALGEEETRVPPTKTEPPLEPPAS